MSDVVETTPVESEEQLVERAQMAISVSRWVVGECASQWTKRYARGRTDADFAAKINVSPDQVFQRRRVWETYGDIYQNFSELKWSHFYAALNWDDASDCLSWAEDNRATVAEMKAWRRAIRGEDLLSEPEAGDELAVGAISYIPDQPAFVQDALDAFNGTGQRRADGSMGQPGEVDEARMAAFARDLDQGTAYAPFHSGAVSAPTSHDEKSDKSAGAPLTPEQLARKLCSALERCEKAISEDFVSEFATVPDKLQARLFRVFTMLQEKLQQLS